MIVAQDEELVVYVGLPVTVTYDFKNDDGTDYTMPTGTYVVKLVNYNSDETNPIVPTLTGGTTAVLSGTSSVVVTVAATDTAKIVIPSYEKNPYEVSDVYAKLIIVDPEGYPTLDIKLKPVKVG